MTLTQSILLGSFMFLQVILTNSVPLDIVLFVFVKYRKFVVVIGNETFFFQI